MDNPNDFGFGKMPHPINSLAHGHTKGTPVDRSKHGVNRLQFTPSLDHDTDKRALLCPQREQRQLRRSALAVEVQRPSIKLSLNKVVLSELQLDHVSKSVGESLHQQTQDLVLGVRKLGAAIQEARQECAERAFHRCLTLKLSRERRLADASRLD
ncbi:hypothetical protein J7U46_16045 [Pelomonas sp. V22]|uniref:hypothetical protein n=1 Tax=Pelomonas sp. V22 TaxID=2822139 RepID=UPI0024A89BAF|nr:hypothetical protein [Pelomonas sp. V22]MDI4634571.1 hypothetical protein [Pelomonas sp. V22]